ncbi:ectonucleoside triphosphate diphosphohydrolase 8 [Latimeria chalumnae]
MNHIGKSIVLVILGIAVISGVIALILSLVQITDIFPPAKIKYGMVFDAGSSHTSLYVYKWPADKENETGIVSQVLECEAKGGGISSYNNDPPKAGESLRTCLKEAQKAIPAGQHQETPVYLGATAGMRLLRKENDTQSNEVLLEVSKTIKQYPFRFGGAKILTGEVEGASGWMTVNYLLEGFIKYSFKGKWIHPPSTNILGALDLGGASTQITFVPNVVIKDKKTEKNLRLYGYNYTVYTHSYLCFGKDQMLKLMTAKLKQSTNSVNIDNPCYPDGYKGIVTMGSIYGSPCTTDLAPPSYSDQQNITFSGTGKPEECLAAVREIFNFTSCGNSQTCTFNGIYQPPVTGRFFAFSAFYYTIAFLNLTSGVSLEQANNTIRTFCKRPWTELAENYPKEKKQNRLQDYCASGYYILTLLVDAYKFDSTTWKSITFQRKAANTAIGWTLGYMLNQTNMVPSEAPGLLKGHNSRTWAAATFFIVFTIFLSLLALALLILNSKA